MPRIVQTFNNVPLAVNATANGSAGAWINALGVGVKVPNDAQGVNICNHDSTVGDFLGYLLSNSDTIPTSDVATTKTGRVNPDDERFLSVTGKDMYIYVKSVSANTVAYTATVLS